MRRRYASWSQKVILSIRNCWVCYGGLSSSMELDAMPTDEMVLGIVKETLPPRPGQELDARQIFTWWTATKREDLRAGRWTVDVLYRDARRSPVQCRIAGDAEAKRCHFEIGVR